MDHSRKRYSEREISAMINSDVDESKERMALKLKLRRSTEQSMYKIDANFTHDKSTHKARGKSGRHSKTNRQKFSDILLNTASVNEKKYMNKKEDDDNTLSLPQSTKGTPRQTGRIRKPTSRYIDYIEPINISSPTLRNRKVINYNEDELCHSLISAKKKQTVKSNLCNTPKSSKRNYVHSGKHEEDDDNTTLTKIIKTRSSAQFNSVHNTVCSDRDIEIDMECNHILSTPGSKLDKHSHHKTYLDTEETPKKRDIRKSMSFVNKENRVTVANNNIDRKEDERISELCADTQNLLKDGISTPKSTSRQHKRVEVSDKSDLLNTPKLRVVSKRIIFTPSLEKRASILKKPSTPLQEARARLHVSTVPKSLPCREEEFNNIFTFLEGKLTDNSGGCIYISGVPGTGKTATVNEVVRCLKRSVAKGNLEDFEFIEINGMKLTEPRQAYVQILKQLTGQTLTWEQAHRTLEKRFNNKKSNGLTTLLLVDELDLLCTKRQDVVYNLLDWPAKATAHLVVITIANTMDLPERILMGRVTSRLGLTRLTFQPYTHKQLQEIVLTRLKDSKAFRSEAIQLVARKVAAVSGDARRALDICRRATEIAEFHKTETVSIQDVNEALTEMIASAKVQAIKNCSEMEKIFLNAMCAEVTRTGVEETYFKNVYRQLESLCSFEGIKIPTITETLNICARLGSSRLLICEHSRADIYQRIFLNVSADDIHFALQSIDLS